MIGMGAALILHSLHKRWKHRAETHSHPENNSSLSYWVVFIIFVLGPCEALLPLLTASAVLGTMSVILVALTFSVATIVTMLAAVITGRFGLNVLRFPWLERFAPEIAGGTVMLCGLAIVCLGL